MSKIATAANFVLDHKNKIHLAVVLYSTVAVVNNFVIDRAEQA